MRVRESRLSSFILSTVGTPRPTHVCQQSPLPPVTSGTVPSTAMHPVHRHARPPQRVLPAARTGDQPGGSGRARPTVLGSGIRLPSGARASRGTSSRRMRRPGEQQRCFASTGLAEDDRHDCNSSPSSPRKPRSRGTPHRSPGASPGARGAVHGDRRGRPHPQPVPPSVYRAGVTGTGKTCLFEVLVRRRPPGWTSARIGRSASGRRAGRRAPSGSSTLRAHPADHPHQDRRARAGPTSRAGPVLRRRRDALRP
jgi:hypothetical protein